MASSAAKEYDNAESSSPSWTDAPHESPSWDAARYQSQHSFVWKYGSSLMDLLNPQPHETILDVGCGTGELTHQIHQQTEEGRVVGVDADPAMMARAKRQFSSSSSSSLLEFRVHNILNSLVGSMEPVDAIFSNAALHWVRERPERAVQNMADILKPQGRLVVEFGGKGNVQNIVSYLERTCGEERNPWYFPSIGEYCGLLEQQGGLEVTLAQLYDRPTALEGEEGLRNWILMFGGSFWNGLEQDELERVLQGAETALRPMLYHDGQWHADYRRIRVVAVKSV